MNARPIACAVLGVWMLCSAPPSYAQVLGPQMNTRAFEAGIGVRFTDRSLEIEDAGRTYDLSFHLTEAFFRFGVTRWLTLSGETGVANTHALERLLHEHNGDGRYLVVGVGAQTALFSRRQWGVRTALQASRTVWVTRESDLADELHSSLLAAVVCERGLDFGAHHVDVWAGPTYEPLVVDTRDRIPRGGGRHWESTGDWGFVVGGAALWYSRVSTSLYAVYAGHIQPRVGVAWRFE